MSHSSTPRHSVADAAASTTRAASVCMVGLGAMGLPMARRLAEQFSVTAFDVSAERRGIASGAGVQVTDDLRSAVRPADVVFVMVRTPEQLIDALFGPGGVVEHLAPAATVIVCSTVGTDGVVAASKRLRGVGHPLVDAPVSGGPRRAEHGDLLITVGADPAAYARVEDVLTHLASTLTIVGDEPGAGQTFKTVNQLLCGVHIAAAAEALALAERLGLNPRSTLEALQSGAAASFMLGDRGPRMCAAIEDGQAEVASRLDLFIKDLGIVTSAAAEAALPVPVATAAHELFLAGGRAGLAESDDSQVVRALLGDPRAE